MLQIKRIIDNENVWLKVTMEIIYLNSLILQMKIVSVIIQQISGQVGIFWFLIQCSFFYSTLLTVSIKLSVEDMVVLV